MTDYFRLPEGIEPIQHNGETILIANQSNLDDLVVETSIAPEEVWKRVTEEVKTAEAKITYLYDHGLQTLWQVGIIDPGQRKQEFKGPEILRVLLTSESTKFWTLVTHPRAYEETVKGYHKLAISIHKSAQWVNSSADIERVTRAAEDVEEFQEFLRKISADNPLWPMFNACPISGDIRAMYQLCEIVNRLENTKDIPLITIGSEGHTITKFDPVEEEGPIRPCNKKLPFARFINYFAALRETITEPSQAKMYFQNRADFAKRISKGCMPIRYALNSELPE